MLRGQHFKIRQQIGADGINGLSKHHLKLILIYFGCPTYGNRSSLTIGLERLSRLYKIRSEDFILLAILLEQNIPFEWSDHYVSIPSLNIMHSRSHPATNNYELLSSIIKKKIYIYI